MRTDLDRLANLMLDDLQRSDGHGPIKFSGTTTHELRYLAKKLARHGVVVDTRVDSTALRSAPTAYAAT